MFMIPSLVAISVGFTCTGYYGAKAFGDVRARIDTMAEVIDFGRNVLLTVISLCILVAGAHSLAV